jgi:GntR family transcriptional regulator, transcriptional repressor for pyruvate dehydrogenase complex
MNKQTATKSPGNPSVVERLHRLVTEHLEPGAKLPTEADLAERFQVSRLTVREALKVLSGRGLVELQQGKRTVVRELDSSVLSDYLNAAVRRDPRGMLELLEIRRALEGLAAALAARNGTRAGLAAIESSLSDMATALESDADASGSDVAFHEALALASGNRMLSFILEGLADALLESFKLSAEGRRFRGGEIRETLESHRAIFEYVKAGDPGGATTQMSAHLRDAEEDLKSAIRERSSELWGNSASQVKTDGKDVKAK